VTQARGRGRPTAGAGIDGDAVLVAALAAFADKGFDGVSVREIARQIGISHALINARFGSKQDLWFAAMSHVLAGLEHDLRETATASIADDMDALRAGIVQHVIFAATHPEVQRIMSHEGAVDSERIRFIVERFVAPLQAIVEPKLAALAAAGRIHHVPYTTFHFLVTHGGGSLFASAVEARLLGGEVPQRAEQIRRHAEQVADLVINGFAISQATTT
jgi:TetR/AcrR family transcriptional regulator